MCNYKDQSLQKKKYVLSNHTRAGYGGVLKNYAGFYLSGFSGYI